jgi:hypothetical protein
MKTKFLLFLLALSNLAFAQLTIQSSGPLDICVFNNNPNDSIYVVSPQAGFTYTWYIGGYGCPTGAGVPYAFGTSMHFYITGEFYCVGTSSSASFISNPIRVRNLPGMPGSPLMPAPRLYTGGPACSTSAQLCIPDIYHVYWPGTIIQWYRDNILITGASAGSYTATTTGYYKYSITSWCMTAWSDSSLVTTAPPTAIISANGPTTFCSNGSVILNANAGAGLTYQWRLNGGNILGAVVHSYNATAAGNYTCVVSNACGSMTSNIITVTVNSPPPAMITSSGPTVFCYPSYPTLSANTGTGLSYQWRLNGTNIALETSSSLAAYASGNYDCIVTNTCGSTISNAINILSETLPSALITPAGPTSFCAPGSVILNAGTAPGYSFQWRLNSAIIPGATLSFYSAAASGNYDCLVTNTCGTRTSNSITVITEVLPTASNTASGPTTFCAPGSVTLDANTGAGLSYQWRLNGGNISGATTSSYNATASGNYNCVVTNTCGSATSNTISVTVENLASSTITTSGPTTFCNPGSVTLYAAQNTLYAYQWWLNGSPAPGPFATSSAYPATTSGTYQCLIYNTCGMQPSNLVTVTVLSVPSAVITAAGATTFCSPGSVILNANTGPGLSYQWRLNGGNISGAAASSYNATATGNYSCVVSNICGNITSNVISVTVNPLPLAVITATGSTTVCSPNAVTLNANTGAGLSYQWRLNAGNIFGATTSSYNATATGNYNCVVTNSCGSITSNIITVTIAAVPATPGSMTGQATGVCSSTKTYSINPVSGATSYTWTVPSGASLSSGQGTASVNVTFTNSFGSGSISVAATNSCGTSGVSSLTVAGVPAQPGNITGPVSVCHNQNNVDYTIVAVTGATSYTWTAPSGTQIKNGQGTTHIRVRFGNSTGNITVRANNTCGQSPIRTLAIAMPCREEEEISANDFDVTLYPNPVKNILSVSAYPLSGSELIIFNAIGEKIFKSEIRNQESAIDIGSLPDGMYFAEIISGEQRKVLKFIKQE